MYKNFYYYIFIWSSACFGRHTAHHQEPKSALAASGFSYMEGCWTCTLCLTTSINYTSNNLPRMKNHFFLALVVQHAMRMRRIVTWLVRLYSIFFPLSSKKHDFRKEMIRLDVRGSVHHSTIHKEKSNKMQQCTKILLFHIYLKLNMFRATHRPSSGV